MEVLEGFEKDFLSCVLGFVDCPEGGGSDRVMTRRSYIRTICSNAWQSPCKGSADKGFDFECFRRRFVLRHPGHQEFHYVLPIIYLLLSNSLKRLDRESLKFFSVWVKRQKSGSPGSPNPGSTDSTRAG